MDTDRNPIEGGEVTLISSAYPYGSEQNRETKSTNSDGIASFAVEREWRLESDFVRHGSQEFFWNWCVRKHGYQTQLTSNTREEKFDLGQTFLMKKGVSHPCPDKLR